MTSQINKILKDIENLKIKDNPDDIYSLSNILKAILKKNKILNMKIYIKSIIKFTVIYMKNAKFVKL